MRNGLVREPARQTSARKKWKNLVFFNFLDSFFGFATCFLLCRWCGVARKRFFVILDPFLDSFSDCSQARNTGFYSMFVFCRSLTAIFKNAKTTVNTSVLCRPVAKNIANTSVFGRWVKKTMQTTVFLATWPSKTSLFAVALPPGHKSIVNNGIFIVFFHVSTCFMFRTWLVGP